jgi:hypothetical protein
MGMRARRIKALLAAERKRGKRAAWRSAAGCRGRKKGKGGSLAKALMAGAGKNGKKQSG